MNLRGDNIVTLSNPIDIECQIIDWDFCDKEFGKNDIRFMIYAYGVTEKGTSVCIHIKNFPPFYFISLDKHLSKEKLDLFMSTLKNKLPRWCSDDIENYDIVKKKKFYGFSNNEEFSFIRILFKNTRTLYKCRKILDQEFKITGMKPKKYELYESNIPPLLRFMHIMDVKPAGWIKISSEKSKVVEVPYSNTQIEIEIDWKDIVPIEKTIFAPFLIASFDIECDSSHGDFPLPKKTYSKLCREIIYNLVKNKVDKTEITSRIKESLKEAFRENPKNVSKIFTKYNKIPNEIKFDLASSNLTELYYRKENYKILANDIILYFRHEKKDIQNIIEDAFCNTKTIEEKVNGDINFIYTKQNNKPKESVIVKVTSKIYNLYKKYICESEINKELELAIENYSDYYKLDTKERKKLFETNIKVHKTIELFVDQVVLCLEKAFPEIDSSKEIMIKRFDSYLSYLFPEVEGDKVIQIGTTIQKYGEDQCFLKHILTLNGCEEIDGCVVESFEDEGELLLRWTEFIRHLDPDIITGYNIFGFDYSYMIARAEELECLEEFCTISRIRDKESKLVCKTLSSSALGDNTLKYIEMEGRVQIDLLKVIQRDHNLPSYKLDYVAENFINNKIECFDKNKIKLKGISTLGKGNFVTFNTNKDKYKEGKKFKIMDINYDSSEITINEHIEEEIKEWTLAKDDVSPNDIFRYQKGSDYDRKVIATYCIMDCALCLHIINKLKIITNNIAMANVCSVPLSFIFLRGQGIKIFSLVSKECRKEKFLIPVIKYKSEEKTSYNPRFEYSFEDNSERKNEGYEGAGVLKPKTAIYLDKYAVVLDFSSLYPSCIISENISQDSIVLDHKYKGEEGAKLLEELGYTYKDITFKTYKWVDPMIRSKGKVESGSKTCRYVRDPKKKAILPAIEETLLKERKKKKKQMLNEPDPILKEIYDGEQLAIKLTCNSLYGQIGAETSPICMIDLAASVTATGRGLLYMARDRIKEKFEDADALYGDTDSVFMDFKPKDSEGNLLTGKEGLKRAIELGMEAEKYVQNFLEAPHKLEYEKTFWPFILFSKKRYIGHKYEFDVNKYKETSMGIVTKRRDNANIVKHLYHNVVNNIMVNRNINKSIDELRKETNDMVNGKFPLDMLVVTKTLKGTYKNPDQIGHKVLAERMGKRDPGNKPMVNDRIPYVYIQTKEIKGKRILQGDRIEHPDYIKDNNIKPDYKFYITNQIMKPICQIYSLILENLDGFKKEEDYFDNKYRYLLHSKTEEKAKIKINELRMEETCKIIFGDILNKIEMKNKKIRPMTDFFKKKCI